MSIAQPTTDLVAETVRQIGQGHVTVPERVILRKALDDADGIDQLSPRAKADHGLGRAIKR